MPAASVLFSWISNLGVGIQSSFAWAQFNQTAYTSNVAMRQNQAYQKKNYNISWVSMARSDLRDMMSISVARINNYMIVSALILGMSSSALYSVTFRSGDPPFLQLVFMMSMGMSVVFLMLAIFLGVKGQNSAFSNTMKLLTYEVRPENPAEYTHDYMKTAQWVEQQGLGTLFRLPGVMPGYYRSRKNAQAEPDMQHAYPCGPCAPAASSPSGPNAFVKSTEQKAHQHVGQAPREELNMPNGDSLENLDVVGQQQLWYLFKFSHFMRLWMPFDVYCKFAMSLGVISLGQGSMYFSLTKMFFDLSLPVFSVLCVTFPFLYFPMMVIHENFKFPSKRTKAIGVLLQILGPLFGAWGVIFDDMEGVQVVCVPMCFLAHALFYLAVFFVAYSTEDDAKLPSIRSEDVFTDMISGFGSVAEKEPADTPAYAAAVGSAAERVETGGASNAYNYYDEHMLRRDDDGVRTWENDTKYHPKLSKEGVFRTVSALPEANRANSSYNDSTGWPTDSEFFGDQVESLARRVRGNVRNALLVALTLYVGLFIWSIMEINVLSYQQHGRFFRPRPKRWPHSIREKVLQVDWGDDVFRPTSVTVNQQHIFVCDRFRIFEVYHGRLVRIECSLQRPIMDIAAKCPDAAEGGLCKVYALVERPESAHGGYDFVNCGTRKATRLQQTPSVTNARSSLYAEWTNGESVAVLVAAHRPDLTQYKKNTNERDGWVPQWTVEKVIPDSFRALSVNKYATMIFTDREVNVYNKTTMQQIGVWTLPPTLGNMTSGCAIPGTAKALVLTYQGKGMPKPRLSELSFPGFDATVMHRRPLRRWSSTSVASSTEGTSANPFPVIAPNLGPHAF